MNGEALPFFRAGREDLAARSLRCEGRCPPHALPRGIVVPPDAPPLPELPTSGDKVGMPLVLPEQAWSEVQTLAHYLDDD